MKYTTEAFDEWWFTTQFDRVYWQVNSQKHQTEYKWAKLAWDAARRGLIAEVERLKIENIKLSEQLNYYNMAFRGRQELSLAAWTQKTIKELQDQLQAAQAHAAQHLADQDYLVALERKRVVEEFREAIYYDSPLRIAVSGDVKAAAEYEKRLVAICKKYGAEEVKNELRT